MKRIKLPLLVLFVLFLSSCLKNENLREYTYYTPVYATAQEVQDNVKNTTPRAIENMGNMIVYHNYILAVEHTKGIHIIDASSSSSPVKVGFIPIPGNQNMAVRNNYLYADCYRDLFIIDINDLQNVKLAAVKQDVFKSQATVMGFPVDDNHIIVDWIKKDTAVTEEYANTPRAQSSGIFFTDMSAAFNGNSSGGGNSTSGSMARFTLVNDYLYAVDNFKLYSFSLANAMEPILSNEQSIGGGIETIFPFKDNLFIGSTTGMMIYNITNPSYPNREGSFSHATACDPVIANDKFAFVTLRGGTRCNDADNQMDVLNIENVKSPSLIKTYPMTSPHGLSLSGNTLFLCDGDAGLRVLDATDVNNIKEKKRFKNIGVATDVITIGNRAYVITQEEIKIYEFSSTTDVKLKGNLSK